jgi:hypothetical protein
MIYDEEIDSFITLQTDEHQCDRGQHHPPALHPLLPLLYHRHRHLPVLCQVDTRHHSIKSVPGLGREPGSLTMFVEG